MKNIVTIGIICSALSACGGGSGESSFQAVGFDNLTPTRKGVNEKAADFINLVYALEDEEDNLKVLKRSEYPQQTVTFNGNLATNIGQVGFRKERVIIGDTTLTINVNKTSDQISGLADNFVVGDFTSSGDLSNHSAKLDLADVFYTTKGSLDAYGSVGSDEIMELGYNGDLDVYEDGAFLDVVSVDSEGVGLIYKNGSDNVLIGALLTSVTAEKESDLDVNSAKTIVWAK